MNIVINFNYGKIAELLLIYLKLILVIFGFDSMTDLLVTIRPALPGDVPRLGGVKPPGL